MSSQLASKHADASKIARDLSAANLKKLSKGNKDRLKNYTPVEYIPKYPTCFAWPDAKNENIEEIIVENENSNKDELRYSEYKEKFPIWTLPSKTQIPQPALWSPFTLAQDDIDSSKWTTEQRSQYQPDELENLCLNNKENSTAGNKSLIPIKAPTFFAWKLLDTKKKSSNIVEEVPIINEITDDVSDCNVSESCNNDFQDECIISVCDSTHHQEEKENIQHEQKKSQDLKNPMGLWSDHLDEAKWHSEYDSNFTKNNKEIQCNTEVKYDNTQQIKCCDDLKKTAGLNSGIRQESPYMYAWSAIDNKYKSEYTSNFDKKPEMEKVQRKLPSNNTISPFYADDAGLTAKWKSEYGTCFDSKKEEEKEEEKSKCNNTAIENKEIDDEESFVFIEHDDINNKIENENVPVIKATKQPNNDIPGLEITIYDPSTESTRIKKVYHTENNSQYLWPEKISIRETFGVDNKLSCQDNIFPSSTSQLDSKSNTTENKSQYLWPEKSEKRESMCIKENSGNIFAVNQDDKTPIVANLSESKSSYTWPEKIAKLNRSSIGGEIKNTNFIHPDPVVVEKATTTSTTDHASTYMSNDSLEPVHKQEQSISDTLIKDSRPSTRTPSVCSSKPSIRSSRGGCSRSFDMNSLGNSVGRTSTLSIPTLKSKNSLQMEAIKAADQHSAKQSIRRNMIKNPKNLFRNTNVNHTKKIGEKFNPALYNKRYPPNSDKQIGRWITESKSAFTIKNPISAQ